MEKNGEKGKGGGRRKRDTLYVERGMERNVGGTDSDVWPRLCAAMHYTVQWAVRHTETQYMLKFNEQCRTGGTNIRNPKLGVKLNVSSIFGSFSYFEGSIEDLKKKELGHV